MKKGTYRLLEVLWVLALVGTRAACFFYGSQSVADTYEYYAHAMIQAERGEPVLTSGMAYAYIRNLSGVLAFLGNRMEVIGIYQLVLQILWMVLFFLGAGMVFGRMAQMFAGTILAASPWILESVFVISPENYFMSVFSLLLLMLGLFSEGMKKKLPYGDLLWGALLGLTALGIGMVCTWNYLGWLLLPVAIYTLAKSRGRLFHAGILPAGILLGIFATLLKYTRLTGFSLGEQFAWWLAPLKALPKRCQDLSIQMAVWLLLAGMTGVLITVITESIKQKRLHGIETESKEAVPDEKNNEAEKTPRYTITQDGRKVELLENPLPLPKRHEKRKMEFKYDDLPKEDAGTLKEWADQAAGGQEFDDFDVAIPENDDFDV